jgi:hypothetical protein
LGEEALSAGAATAVCLRVPSVDFFTKAMSSFSIEQEDAGHRSAPLVPPATGQAQP